jgi:hypothetical protein
LLRDSLQGVLAPSDEENSHAASSECKSDRPTDATASSCYEGNTPCQQAVGNISQAVGVLNEIASGHEIACSKHL